MRSLRYFLGGKPHNRDDCLDLAGREGVMSVSLDLITSETPTEQDVLKHLVGVWRWEFSQTGRVKYEEVYGGFSALENKERQLLGVEKGNEQLARAVGKVEALGILVEGDDKRFKDDVIYRRGR